MALSRPACFGSPVSVSALSASCRECASATGCVYAAGQVLAKLPESPLLQRARLDLRVTGLALADAPPRGGQGQGQRTVAASTRGIKRITLTAREEALVGSLKGRVASQVRKLMELGWFSHAREELRAGRNPADKGWRRVLCHELLQGGASRPALQLAFAASLGLTDASAKAQVSFAVSIFSAGQLILERDSIITLSQ